MDARKFHGAVFPGTDFNAWLVAASAEHPADFGTSDDGENQTITLLRARTIAFGTTGALNVEALKTFFEVVASGVANSGAVANARFDELILANGIYVMSWTCVEAVEGGSDA